MSEHDLTQAEKEQIAKSGTWDPTLQPLVTRADPRYRGFVAYGYEIRDGMAVYTGRVQPEEGE